MTARTAVCHTCRLKHRSPLGTREAEEFFHRHHNHRVELMPERPLFAGLRERLAQLILPPVAVYADNSSVKESYGNVAAFTITNANLATSATAGWMSNAIDNSANLYLDALVHVALAAVNTAPANTKSIYLFAYALVDTGASLYTSTGSATPSGSEGTLTFPDITTNACGLPLLGVIPYPTQNTAINGGPFSVARAFGGILPPKWGVAMINHSGMTLSVTSIKYIEQYNTVA